MSDPRPAMIPVHLNGKPAEIPAGQSLLDLLEARGLHPRTVMVEVNERTVRREQYAETVPGEGDRIEIVRMIAGG